MNRLKLLKLMAALAVGAAALVMVGGGGAASADDRFRFASCSVEFILQDGRFVAVDGRSWAEVDPTGACHETAESDDSPTDGGRSAPGEVNQQDDGEDGASAADSPVGAEDDPAPQAQEQQDGTEGLINLEPPSCTTAVKPETGPALISFVDNTACAIVRDGGAVQVSRGDYTLNVTLPAGRDWDMYSHSDAFAFTDFTTNGWIYLNAADGAELRRFDGHCGPEQIIVEETVRIAEDGTVHRHTTYAHGDNIVCDPLEEGFPALLDAIVASATVPAAAAEE